MQSLQAIEPIKLMGNSLNEHTDIAVATVCLFYWNF